MITKLVIDNFYSFGSREEISFLVDNNAPASYAYNKHPLSDERVSKVNLLFGPNASGKTSTLKAVAFLRHMIAMSFADNVEQKIQYQPFRFSLTRRTTSLLAVDFLIAKEAYSYKLVFSQDRIVEEALQVSGYRSKKIGKQYVFRKKFNEGKKRYDIQSNKAWLPQVTDAFQRTNTSLIAVSAQNNNEKMLLIQRYWKGIIANLTEWGTSDHRMRVMLDLAIRYYFDHPDVHKQADELLADFDLGLSGTRIEEVNSPEKEGEKLYPSFGIHKSNVNAQYLLPLRYESRGTQALYTMLHFILPQLHMGSVVVLDDFDESLHPMMVPKILDLFLDPDRNPNGAQLIASGHSVYCMDGLDKYQIFLSEKDEMFKSHVWRLDGVEGVRSDVSYLKKYLSGAFGAVPDV